jgi:catechol 2,3-dioxygenase-like lactoylglutathione lyase family enzyme
VFLWIGPDKRSMLGLWGPSTTRGNDPHRCHFAIALPMADLVTAGKRLNDLGVATRNFAGEETTEPSVIGWMPSAQLYFRDPDDHSVEFITVLDDRPDADFIGPLSTWQKRDEARRSESKHIEVRGLEEIVFEVKDLERSIAFYQNTLGLSLQSRGPQEAWFRVGNQSLALFTPERIGSGQHFAFLIPPQDAERMRCALAAQGFPEETMQQEKGLSVYVRDPDGNKIELYAKQV